MLPLFVSLMVVSMAPVVRSAVPPQGVIEALQSASPPSIDRIAVLSYRPVVPAGCTVERAQLLGALEGSGQVEVRLVGQSTTGLACEGWATLQVKMFGQLWVTVRAVRSGEPMKASVQRVEHELQKGTRPVDDSSGDELANQSLAAGAVVEVDQVRRTGPAIGSNVSVHVRVGGIEVEQIGQLIPCSRGRACARLPSGKRVEGVMDGNSMVVEVL